MNVLVTGARGKVGAATVRALIQAGHAVTATDVTRGIFERPAPDEPAYIQADLTEPGDAFSLMKGMEAVVHAAAIPDPTHNLPATVFQNNIMATFNVLEAAIRFGVSRLVNISSETVPGFFFPERPFLPDYVPVDSNGALVVIPNRGLFAAHPVRGPEAVPAAEGLLRLARRQYDTGPGPVSDQLFWWRDGVLYRQGSRRGADGIRFEPTRELADVLRALAR